mgnify:CR=1 FL=1
MSKLPELSPETIDRVVEMAWEDRTPFEAIETQFGLSEKEVLKCGAKESADAIPSIYRSASLWKEDLSRIIKRHRFVVRNLFLISTFLRTKVLTTN